MHVSRQPCLITRLSPSVHPRKPCSQSYQHVDADLEINGPAADLWATGVLLFEMLFGELPFCVDETLPLPDAPACVPDDEKSAWQQYEAVRRLHQAWVGHDMQLLLYAPGDGFLACMQFSGACLCLVHYASCCHGLRQYMLLW